MPILKALVTSGPTRERLDPVRYLTNDSSGKQGHAIAQALAKAGVEVTLVSGPVVLPDPVGVRVVQVETAQEMLAACEAALPVDIAICAAAVCDWRPAVYAPQKMKKTAGQERLVIEYVKNPDILSHLGHHALRPKVLVGFAAETENILENARAKLVAKKCDLILANDVSGQVFGSDHNSVTQVSATGEEVWERLSKTQVAERLVERVLQKIQLTVHSKPGLVEFMQSSPLRELTDMEVERDTSPDRDVEL